MDGIPYGTSMVISKFSFLIFLLSGVFGLFVFCILTNAIFGFRFLGKLSIPLIPDGCSGVLTGFTVLSAIADYILRI